MCIRDRRYVFPGGRVEVQDSRVRTATSLRPDVEELLTRSTTPPRARALAAAAVRETFEETGLTIGKPDTLPEARVPKNWRKFFENGVAPSFEHLNYIARAVTPHWRPIRFNARFFMIAHQYVSGELGGDGELLDLSYIPIQKTKDFDLPLITTRVMELVEALARNPPEVDKHRTAKYFQHNGEFHDIFDE